MVQPLKMEPDADLFIFIGLLAITLAEPKSFVWGFIVWRNCLPNVAFDSSGVVEGHFT